MKICECRGTTLCYRKVLLEVKEGRKSGGSFRKGWDERKRTNKSPRKVAKLREEKKHDAHLTKWEFRQPQQKHPVPCRCIWN